METLATGDERISTFVAIILHSSSSSPYGSSSFSKAEFNMLWYKCREDLWDLITSCAGSCGGRISMLPCSSPSSATSPLMDGGEGGGM